MDDMAKEINSALDKDFADVPKMRHLNIPPPKGDNPHDRWPPTDAPTATTLIDATIAYLEAQIKALHEVRRRL